MGNQLETWQVILIIVGVLGVIWSNIALLKYSAKFEMKKKIDEQTAPFDKDKVTSKNNRPQNNPKKDED